MSTVKRFLLTIPAPTLFLTFATFAVLLVWVA